MHPHQSCQVKSLEVARSILVILVPLIRCAGFYFALRNEFIKVRLVKDHQAIYIVSHCDHWNRYYGAMTGYNWLNIPNSHLFMFIVHLLRRSLLLYTSVCKRSRIKFSIAGEFFNCALFQYYLKSVGIPRTRLVSTRSVWTSPSLPDSCVDQLGCTLPVLICGEYAGSYLCGFQDTQLTQAFLTTGSIHNVANEIRTQCGAYTYERALASFRCCVDACLYRLECGWC
jgi:hypothetical protein